MWDREKKGKSHTHRLVSPHRWTHRLPFPRATTRHAEGSAGQAVDSATPTSIILNVSILLSLPRGMQREKPRQVEKRWKFLAHPKIPAKEGITMAPMIRNFRFVNSDPGAINSPHRFLTSLPLELDMESGVKERERNKATARARLRWNAYVHRNKATEYQSFR